MVEKVAGDERDNVVRVMAKCGARDILPKVNVLFEEMMQQEINTSSALLTRMATKFVTPEISPMSDSELVNMEISDITSMSDDNINSVAVPKWFLRNQSHCTLTSFAQSTLDVVELRAEKSQLLIRRQGFGSLLPISQEKANERANQ